MPTPFAGVFLPFAWLRAGTFALTPEHFARLLGADRRTADLIFDGIFDTDVNGLVDAFEAM